MSIVNALNLFFAPDTSVASSKLEGWKSALSQKVDETSALVDDQFSSLLQRVDQTSSNLDQFNELRREFKRKSANLYNYLLERNEPGLFVNFQPVNSIESGKLKQNISNVKSGLLKKLSKKLEALKAEIRNCRNVEELKVLINKVKTFRDGIKIILTEQILITPALAPQPAPAPPPAPTPQSQIPSPVVVRSAPAAQPTPMPSPTPTAPVKPKPPESGIIISSSLGKVKFAAVSEGRRFTGEKLPEKKVQPASMAKATGIASSDPEEKKMSLLQYFNGNFGQNLDRKLKFTPVPEYSLTVNVDIIIKVSANGRATILRAKNKSISLNEKAKKEKAFFNRAAEEAIKYITKEIKNYKYKDYGLEKTFQGKPFTVSIAYSRSI